eukprot:TRINITY_DN16265_c0_g1_i1.p1 TRINITY_DN16265_c0_g1~~TRINITY_DN16265_c0_g1_i1.p1  ORF type:complete len:348 (+),score=92.29 TRINITY_DN16265_c0_g1_i1:137-1045(+)
MASATTEALIASLAAKFPDDAGDLQEALEELRKQKLGSVERLARLSDVQWQRLGFPLGIEALIREELEASAAPPVPAPAPAPAPSAPSRAPAPRAAAARQPLESQAREEEALRQAAYERGRGLAADDDDICSSDGELPLEPYEPPQGLRQRSGRGAPEASRRGDRSERSVPDTSGSLLGPMDLRPPENLDELWEQLLEDCLPPDKRAALQDSWEATGSESDRYLMFLEYSSYLRKPEVSEEQREAHRKQMEPLMRELGLPRDEDEGSGGIWLPVVFGLILLIVGVVYYVSSGHQPAHDMQAL